MKLEGAEKEKIFEEEIFKEARYLEASNQDKEKAGVTEKYVNVAFPSLIGARAARSECG